MAFKKTNIGKVNSISDTYSCGGTKDYPPIKFRYYIDNTEDDWKPFLHVEFFLYPTHSFIKRVMIGLRYIFGAQNHLGKWYKSSIEKDDAEKLSALFSLYVESYKNAESIKKLN